MNCVLIVAVTLSALFALNDAQSLTCYSGTGTGGNIIGGIGTGFTQQSNCSACKKVVGGVNTFGVSISSSTSSCVPVGSTCTPSNVGVLGVGEETLCCSTNLCNTASGRHELNVLLAVFGLLTAAVTFVKIY